MCPNFFELCWSLETELMFFLDGIELDTTVRDNRLSRHIFLTRSHQRPGKELLGQLSILHAKIQQGFSLLSLFSCFPHTPLHLPFVSAALLPPGSFTPSSCAGLLQRLLAAEHQEGKCWWLGFKSWLVLCISGMKDEFESRVCIQTFFSLLDSDF